MIFFNNVSNIAVIYITYIRCRHLKEVMSYGKGINVTQMSLGRRPLGPRPLTERSANE